MYKKCFKKTVTFFLLFYGNILLGQTNAEKDAFAEAFVNIFQNRSNQFDSITLFSKIIDGAYDASVKLPGADKCVIRNNRYLAEYGFSDKARAIAFFKTVQGWLNYAAGAYSSRVLFVPHYGDAEHLRFFLSDSSGFIDAENYLRIANSKNAKPFSVHLEIDSDPTMAYYTNYGIRINNTALTSLIKEVGFGNDPEMTKIKKNKKSVAIGVIYESSRTIPGYSARIFENEDEDGEITDYQLELVKKWTGSPKTVNQKVDSLIFMLKAALPSSFCYVIAESEQTVFFYQHPFAEEQHDAEFTIEYGLDGNKKDYYTIALFITRRKETEPVLQKEEKKLYPFKDANGKYGYRDEGKKVIVAGKYDEAADFREERGRVVLNKRYGYVDISGKEVVALKYSYASLFFFDGVAEVQLNGKHGLVDVSGKEVVPLRYDHIDREQTDYDDKRPQPVNTCFLVKLSGKAGMIDQTGREIVPLRYEEAEWIDSDKAIVKLNNLWGMIDKRGKQLTPVIYDYIHRSYNSKDEYVSPRLNKKYGLMEKSGKLIIPVKYDQVSIGFSENLCRIELNKKFGFVDNTGREIIPPKYENVDDFSEGLAEAKMNGKWGFIDKTGKQVIGFKYESTWSFTQGLAAVELNNKWGYIDKTGKTVIPFKYDDAREFDKQGQAKVYIGKKWGKINTKGVVIKPIENEGADPDDDDSW